MAGNQGLQPRKYKRVEKYWLNFDGGCCYRFCKSRNCTMAERSRNIALAHRHCNSPSPTHMNIRSLVRPFENFRAHLPEHEVRRVTVPEPRKAQA